MYHLMLLFNSFLRMIRMGAVFGVVLFLFVFEYQLCAKHSIPFYSYLHNNPEMLSFGMPIVLMRKLSLVFEITNTGSYRQEVAEVGLNLTSL